MKRNLHFVSFCIMLALSLRLQLIRTDDLISGFWCLVPVSSAIDAAKFSFRAAGICQQSSIWPCAGVAIPEQPDSPEPDLSPVKRACRLYPGSSENCRIASFANSSSVLPMLTVLTLAKIFIEPASNEYTVNRHFHLCDRHGLCSF